MTTTAMPKFNSPEEQIAWLQKQLEEKEAKLAEATAKKPRAPRKAKALTPEEQAAADAKAAARVAFETIDYAKKGSPLRQLQDMGRATHVYAFYKVVKHLSYGRLAQLLFDLIGEIATSTGKSVDEVMTQVTTRVPKAEKSAEPAGEPSTEG